MPITVIYRRQELQVPAPTTVAAALYTLGLPPELYLVIRDGILLDAEEELRDGDTIQLIGVISGGSLVEL